MKIKWSSVGMLVLILFIVNYVTVYGQEQANQRIRPPSSLNLRAPVTIPGTHPAMLDASYWIAKMKDPGKIILTQEEIHDRNKTFIQRLNNFSGLDSALQKQITQELDSRPGLFSSIPETDTVTPSELSETVTGFIDKQVKYLRSRRWGNKHGIEYSDRELETILIEMAISEIGEVNKKQGITVRNCRLRIIPSLRPEYTGNTGGGTDMWNLDILPVGLPVQILHSSHTGAFLFILSEKGFGWVHSEEVALGSSKKISGFYNSRNFVICTGDKVPYYSDPKFSYVSGWFRMGDRLKAAENKSGAILVPTRKVNGEVEFKKAWLKPDADVNTGFLPFSRKSVIIQAYKLLNNSYDWTGEMFGRNHATMLRDVFSVFGFKFPSTGGLLSAYGSNTGMVYSNEGIEAQLTAIMANEPFLTLLICSTGHSQLFLGVHNGLPIVFDTHGYRYKDNDGNEFHIRRANIGTTFLPDYFMKQDIRFILIH